MLTRLELSDFKSYKGHHVISFLPFCCVIGPNGAGKSNLFDAISFVLGVRSTQLRSSQLKELIYRGGKRHDPDGDMMDVEGAEDLQDEEDEEPGPSSKRAWVLAVYEDSDGRDWQYQRSITAAGASEYRVNGKVVPYTKYSESLEKHNILVKARNFLVFQGDVEAIASQDAKNLSRLVEQISGSLELKEDYETAKIASERAVEASTLNFFKRRGINSEIRQFREQQEEVKRFETLCRERDNAVIRHVLWKLYHIDRSLEAKQTLIDEKNQALRELRVEQARQETATREARKRQVKAQKDLSTHEKDLKSKEKDIEGKKAEKLAIETQTAHVVKKLNTLRSKETAVQKDRAQRAISLKSLQKSLVETEKAVKDLEREHHRLSQARGLALSDADLIDYRKLRAQASTRAVEERQTVTVKEREARTLADKLAGFDDKLGTSRYKAQKRTAEVEEYSARVQASTDKSARLDSQLVTLKRDLNAAQQERTRFAQMQAELDEKLRDVVSKLLQISADQRESEREVRLTESISTLKRHIPGVHGRVKDLCRPSQQKYNIAFSIVLGRNIDAVVVDSEQTAMQCIQSMRDQRLGTATFLPLDTIQVKPIDPKYRALDHAKMAIDVIEFHVSLERVMHYVCGNSIICDDLDTARQICFGRKQEVKAVTLDGMTIHKSGQMSGGFSKGQEAHSWNSNEAEGLRKHEETLRGKLAELAKSRPRSDQDGRLLGEITRVETDIGLNRDDLSASKSRLKSCADELKHVATEIDRLEARRQGAEEELLTIKEQIKSAQAIIDAADSRVFHDFCLRTGIGSIQEYEANQVRFSEEEGSAKLKADKTFAKLKHQVAFEEEQLQGFDDQLKMLIHSLSSSQTTYEGLRKQEDTIQHDLLELEEETRRLVLSQGSLKAALNIADADLGRIRKQLAHTAADSQTASRDLSTLNDDIEKLAADRLSNLRRCRLEEIDLPLLSGSLESVPLEETEMDTMVVDNEDVSQQPISIADYELKLDIRLLDNDDRKNDTSEHGNALEEAARKIASDLQLMAPNMRALEKLGEVEAKLKATDKDHEIGRREAKEAKDRFEDIRRRRIDLFNTAYAHISERIDKIYKDLTKGKAAPLGGAAYLSLENSDEPYLQGINYHAMPPMKHFCDMEHLSGGEKTLAALALLFAIHSFRPSPFFVLDEVDAALDNTNVGRIAHYVRGKASTSFQFIVISLKGAFYDKANGLVGIWRDVDGGTSRALTLDLEQYA